MKRIVINKWCLIVVLSMYSCVFVSCKKEMKEHNDNNYIYDINIDYNSNNLKGNIAERDSVLFLFEKGFDNDIIELSYANNTLIDTFKTHPALDLSGYMKAPFNKGKVTSYSLIINKGKKILIEIDVNQRIFVINHLNRLTDSAKISVISLTETPIYQ